MTLWLRTLASRCWAVLTRRRRDREFDEELATHLELLIDEGRAGGLSDAEARSSASPPPTQPTSSWRWW